MQRPSSLLPGLRNQTGFCCVSRGIFFQLSFLYGVHEQWLIVTFGKIELFLSVFFFFGFVVVVVAVLVSLLTHSRWCFFFFVHNICSSSVFFFHSPPLYHVDARDNGRRYYINYMVCIINRSSIVFI